MQFTHDSYENYALYTRQSAAHPRQMLDDHRNADGERARLGIPPLPLTPEQVADVTEHLGQRHPDPSLVDVLRERVPPGVHDSARVKAAYLADLAVGASRSEAIDPGQAVALLGTMQGGYNVAPLVALLDYPHLADLAAEQLGRTVLIFDAFDGVAGLAQAGNEWAARVVRSWAEADWFLARPAVATEI